MRGEYSLADIAAATGREGSGFGDNGSWWIIIFLIFALGGWGRNGGFGGGNGIGENYVLATDFATIERKLDSLANGICDSTFALNNTMVNGFASTQQTLCQGFNGLNTALLQGKYDLSSQLADCCCGLKSQLADCCCRIERGIDGINYNNALQTSALQQTLCNNTRDIIDNANANYRALHEELIANKLEMKNERIAEQQNEINALRLKASQEAQNNYLISQLRPCPDPAYIVPNPNCCYDYTVTRNGGCCGSQFI